MVIHTISWPRLNPLKSSIGEMKLGRDIEFGHTAFDQVFPSPRGHQCAKGKAKKQNARRVDFSKCRSI